MNTSIATNLDSLFRVPLNVDTPALIVELDRVEENVGAMARHCSDAGVELLPHAKTHRIVELARLQRRMGADGLTVARLDEAEALVDDGATRIVVAYPLVGAEKVAWAAQLSDRARMTLCVDDVGAARQIARHFAAAQRQADIHLLIDSGFARCGVVPNDALGIAAEISSMPGVRLTGILTHEGHVYTAGDRTELELKSRAAGELMVKLADDLQRSVPSILTVSLGSSASAPFVTEVPGVTQARPGIYAFNDLAQVAFGNATVDRCAARVLSTVISRPAPDRAVIDAGSKSLSGDLLPTVAATLWPGFGLIVDRPGWQLYRLSEEHGWVRWVGSGQPLGLHIGERVQIIPNHVCSAFSSSGFCVAVRAGEVEGIWRTIPRSTTSNRSGGATTSSLHESENPKR